MFDRDFIRRVRAIEIRARHQVTDTLAGDYASAFKGRGLQFEEVRAYVPGDDVRRIDWNVTARYGQPFVKVMREEREMTMVIAVDVSASLDPGNGSRRKREAAAEAAAALALVAERSGDRVGLVLFSDRIESYLPPGRGRGHVWSIIRGVLGDGRTAAGGARPPGRSGPRAGAGTAPTPGRGTDLAGALTFIERVVHGRAMLVVISDFWAEGWQRPLALLGRRHDCIAVTIHAPLERALPDAGVVAWRDVETGASMLIDTSSAGARARIEAALASADRDLDRALKAAGVERLRLTLSEPVVTALARHFRRRGLRRRA